jgi:hypothetical protein
VGWLGFLPGALSDDSPDIRNAIAGLYERYGLAFSSCLNVRAIAISMCHIKLFQKFFVKFISNIFKLYRVGCLCTRDDSTSPKSFVKFFSKLFLINFCQFFVNFFKYFLLYHVGCSCTWDDSRSPKSLVYFFQNIKKKLFVKFFPKIFCQFFSKNFVKFFQTFFLLYHVGCLCTRDDSRSPKMFVKFFSKFFSKLFVNF